MRFDQYHKPPQELSQETRTFARVIQSMIEEAEAIDWYEQRISVEKSEDAKSIIAYGQKEELIHFRIDLAFLMSKKPRWETALKNILFK